MAEIIYAPLQLDEFLRAAVCNVIAMTRWKLDSAILEMREQKMWQ